MNEKELEIFESNLDEETLKAMEEALNAVEEDSNREKSEEELLARFIQKTTREEKLVALNAVALAPPEGVSRENVKKILRNMENSEFFADIKSVKGIKDTYFYDTNKMTDHFAVVQASIQDKNILSAIANAVRHDCKTYPRPVSMKSLKENPYFYSDDEILGAIARMKFDENYKDIDVVTASNGNMCFYSSLYMSKVYAQALCEQIEVEWVNCL